VIVARRRAGGTRDLEQELNRVSMFGTQVAST